MVLLRLECIIDLIETTLPLVNIKGFYELKKKHQLLARGGWLRINSLFLQCLGSETMPYIISQVLLLKAYSANSVIYYIILLLSLLRGKSEMEIFDFLASDGIEESVNEWIDSKICMLVLLKLLFKEYKF